MPNNIFSSEMEESLISCVLKDGESFKILKDICVYKDFWFEPYSWVWYAFQKLYDRNANIDLLTTIDEMQRLGTLERFSTVDGKFVSSDGIKWIQEKDGVNIDSAETYAYRVRDDSSKRKIQEVTTKSNDWINQGNSSIDVITNLEAELGKVAAYSGINTKSIMPISMAVDKAVQETESAKKSSKRYIETGIKSLDAKIGGLFPGELVTIAARAGMGKSSLALTMALNIGIHSAPFSKSVGIFTLEMSSTEYTQRLIAAISGIPALRLKMGKIHDDEEEKYRKAVALIKESNKIYLDDTGNISIPLLRNKMRKMKEMGVDVIIVDQLALITDRMPGEQEYVRIDRMSYQFKNMAIEFDIPIIIIQQMNRSIESVQRGADKEPKSSDLTQSGEGAPSLIIMITHKMEEKIIKESKLWIVKHRDGATGCVNVKFEGERTLFRDLTQEESDSLTPEIMK